MAEPLSLAASILAVVQVAAQLTHLGYGYISGVKRAPEDLRLLMDELRTLETVLRSLEEIIRLNPQSIATLQQLNVGGGPLPTCLLDLQRLQSEIEPKDGMKGFWGNLKWPLKEKDTLAFLARIERHKALFNFALSADQMTLSNKIEEYVRNTALLVQGIKTDTGGTNVMVQEIKTNTGGTNIMVQEIRTNVGDTNVMVQEIKTDIGVTSVTVGEIHKGVQDTNSGMDEFRVVFKEQSAVMKTVNENIQEMKGQAEASRRMEEAIRIAKNRDKVLDWVSRGHSNDKHIEITNRRRENTGNWLLETPQMIDWLKGSGRLLWGYGIPGAGKTFLSSIIINHLMGRAKIENHGVAYIYFEYNEQSQQKPIEVIASLVRQLANQIPLLPRAIEDLHTKLKPYGERATIKDLFPTLLAILGSFSQTFFVFDALDECDEKTQRTQLLPLIHLMADSGISLFVTSREYPEDIQASFRDSPKIKLSAKEEDIKNYIQYKIAEDSRASRLIGHGELRDRIVSDITSLADGMFLLVRFHIEFICQQTTKRQILRELEGLKNSSTGEKPLDSTYKRAMDNVRRKTQNCVKLAINIFSWLVTARRTLTVDEVRQAVSVEAGRYELDELDLLDKATLLDVCAGLVTIDENNLMRLAHFTVQEYLLQNSIIREDADLYLATTCLTFLSFDVFDHQGACRSDESFKNRQRLYPLINYAAAHGYLSLHLRSCDEDLTKDCVLRFLKSGNCISAFTQASYVWNLPGDILLGNYYSYPKDRDRLHTAAILGHKLVVQDLLEKGEMHLNGISNKDSHGHTALHLAAVRGHEAVVKVLFQHGADALVQSNRKIALPLSLAAAAGHEGVVKQLLQNGADTSAQDGPDYFTALHRAVSQGHKGVVQLLLNHGADLTIEDVNDNTPLLIAVLGAQEEIVGMLIDKGADVNGRSKYGVTPLDMAARYGYEKVVGVLLQHGVDISAQGGLNNFTPLHRAAIYGHTGVAQLLLDHGADPSVMGNNDFTPLLSAAVGRHEEVIELLIERGASVDTLTSDGYTALHLAGAGGDQFEKLAKLLLYRGANLSIRTKDNGLTALHLAVLKQNKAVAQLLLHHGADISEVDSNNGSASLAFAAAAGYEEMAELFIEKGSEVNQQDICGLTALHQAASAGQEGIAKILLCNGANLSIPTKDGRTALYLAASGGHKGVVELLLQYGADISSQDSLGSTVLLVASANGHKEVVELLLNYNADTSIPNRDSNTPLLTAVGSGHRDVVELLLNNGANTSVQHKDGYTALLLAVNTKNQEITKLLLEKGADTSAQTDKGYTSLQLAAGRGYKEIVQLLLQHGADTSIKDKDGYIPLHAARFGGHTEIVELLLSSGDHVSAQGENLLIAAGNGDREAVQQLLQYGADISTRDGDGNTVLHVATSRGHTEVVELLLSSGADPSVQGIDDNTPLHVAAKVVDMSVHKIVQLLVGSGANPSAKNIFGITPLQLAVSSGHKEAVQSLLHHGADADTQDSNDQTSLHLAAQGGHNEIIELLLQSGADVSIQDKTGHTALHLAAEDGSMGVSQFLLKYGADVSIRATHGITTSLAIAAYFGHDGIAELLLQHGADPSTVDVASNFYTALHGASILGHTLVVKILLQYGADVSIKDEGGRTALHWAAFRGHVAAVELLLQNGADSSAQEDQGMTALHSAAYQGQEDVTSVLLEHGADCSLLDSQGMTALELAMHFGHDSVAALLLSVQKSPSITPVDPELDGAQEIPELPLPNDSEQVTEVRPLAASRGMEGLHEMLRYIMEKNERARAGGLGNPWTLMPIFPDESELPEAEFLPPVSTLPPGPKVNIVQSTLEEMFEMDAARKGVSKDNLDYIGTSIKSKFGPGGIVPTPMFAPTSLDGSSISAQFDTEHALLHNGTDLWERNINGDLPVRRSNKKVKQPPDTNSVPAHGGADSSIVDTPNFPIKDGNTGIATPDADSVSLPNAADPPILETTGVITQGSNGDTAHFGTGGVPHIDGADPSVTDTSGGTAEHDTENIPLNNGTDSSIPAIPDVTTRNSDCSTVGNKTALSEDMEVIEPPPRNGPNLSIKSSGGFRELHLREIIYHMEGMGNTSLLWTLLDISLEICFWVWWRPTAIWERDNFTAILLLYYGRSILGTFTAAISRYFWEPPAVQKENEALGERS